MVDLSIIIVSWNVKNLLRDCLNSIFTNLDGLAVEVFVSDNASSDGSAEMVKESFPQVKLIANQTNLGFTKANNLAIKQAQGQYVLILNPDTVIQPKALSTMVRFMAENKNCGALGPKLLNPDGSLQPSCRPFPTLGTQLASTLFLDGLVARGWPHDQVKEVDQPMGAALMVRKEVLDQVGLFDENIIFFYDEVDLCYRLKAAGWKIYFTPAAEIIHYQGKSFKQWKDFKKVLWGAYLWRQSRNYFFQKHYGAWQVPILIFLDLFQIAIIFFLFYLVAKLYRAVKN